MPRPSLFTPWHPPQGRHRRLQATACAAWLLGAASLAQGQPAPAMPAPTPAPAAALPYATVAAALADLKGRDGNGTIVTESEGWITVNEPLAGAQWSFAPRDHEAYPAVIRRTIRRGPANALGVDTAALCEAPAPACDRLRQQFEGMNDRIVQALRARGRTGSTPPGTP